ncbi:ATP-binding cassette domain-containing protein [Actinoallomurus spadix]|uniref:ABC transporter domain-containing protein n=1 Tax=Actinoallomurus spadix TaxID=79912 RepID=A0ABP3GE72_9ACTN|nr:ATP-binding cassette domain-containing protein [Actinoallomurus spadix]MCO5984732.1 ATP-binding cassette domain-containing protein [Actinoallomurus spadix]
MPSLHLHALVWPAHGARYHLTLTVPSGRSAVIGTTPDPGTALADVVLGLARPLAGAVRLDGRDITDAPPGERGITLVPVGGGLLPHLNVERNVAYGGDPAHAADRLRDLRLTGMRKRHPHELSPAQRLRVAVARALGHPRNPGVIVFEDRAGQVSCRPAVSAAQAYGATVLVITDRESGALADGAVRPEELHDAT